MMNNRGERALEHFNEDHKAQVELKTDIDELESFYLDAERALGECKEKQSGKRLMEVAKFFAGQWSMKTVTGLNLTKVNKYKTFALKDWEN